MNVAMPVAESSHAPAQTPTPTPRLREEGLTDSDRHFAIGMHISPIALTLLGAAPLGLIAPLVLWAVRKKHSAFDDDHGREVINFGISFFLWHVVLAITFIGVVLWPVLWIVGIVNNIRGAMAANRGEYFRYPMTIRFLS